MKKENISDVDIIIQQWIVTPKYYLVKEASHI